MLESNKVYLPVACNPYALAGNFQARSLQRMLLVLLELITSGPLGVPCQLLLAWGLSQAGPLVRLTCETLTLFERAHAEEWWGLVDEHPAPPRSAGMTLRPACVQHWLLESPAGGLEVQFYLLGDKLSFSVFLWVFHFSPLHPYFSRAFSPSCPWILVLGSASPGTQIQIIILGICHFGPTASSRGPGWHWPDIASWHTFRSQDLFSTQMKFQDGFKLLEEPTWFWRMRVGEGESFGFQCLHLHLNLKLKLRLLETFNFYLIIRISLQGIYLI